MNDTLQMPASKPASRTITLPKDQSIHKLARRSGFIPFTDEELADHKLHLLSYIKQPTNWFDMAIGRYLCKGEPQNPHPLMYFAIFGIGILFAFTGLTALAAGVVWIFHMHVAISAGTFSKLSLGSIPFLVAMMGAMLYIERLSKYVIFEGWYRVDVTADSEELPAHARQCIKKISEQAKLDGVVGLKFQVEYPRCTQIPDPMLFAIGEPTKPTAYSPGREVLEEHCVLAWE